MEASPTTKQDPDRESLRLAMQLAWQDHQHARDQTWRALQIEAVLGAGLVSIDMQFHALPATIPAAALVMVAALLGVFISWQHRKLERRKFFHIMNCEEALGLHREDLIPTEAQRTEQNKEFLARLPEPLSLRAIFWGKGNTALFILRMHIAIILFAAILLGTRIYFTVHGRH